MDLILSFDLVDNQFVVTISFKVLYPHLLSKLETNDQSIVLAIFWSRVLSMRMHYEERDTVERQIPLHSSNDLTCRAYS